MNQDDGIEMDAVDRRPLRSRGSAPIQWLGRVAASSGVSPNAISVASMGFALLGAVVMLAAASAEGALFRVLCVAAVAGVQLRLLANVLDGIVAEQTARATRSGRLLNEWPDRVSDVLLLGAFGGLAGNPRWAGLGLVAALLAVMTAYVRELGRAIDAPPAFHGPMAKPQRMAVLTAALVIMAVWPGLVHRPFWGGAWSMGLVEAALLLIIAGSGVTVVRRLMALHRFARHAEGEA